MSGTPAKIEDDITVTHRRLSDAAVAKAITLGADTDEARAELFSVSLRTYYRMRTGKHGGLRFAMACGVAEALGMSLDDTWVA